MPALHAKWHSFLALFGLAQFDVMVKRIEGASGKAVRISASTFRLSVQGLGPLGVQVAVCRVAPPSHLLGGVVFVVTKHVALLLFLAHPPN